MNRRIVYIILGILLPLSAFAQEADSVSLTLGQCISIASGGNTGVKNAHLDYLSAEMQRREALSYYFPQASVSALGFHALDPLLRVEYADLFGASDAANTITGYLGTMADRLGINTYYENLSHGFGIGVTLMQPLYAGGKIVTGYRLASLGVEAASLNEAMARRDAAVDVERKYWLAVSLEEKARVVADGIALVESLAGDATAALAGGLVSDEVQHQAAMARQELRSRQVQLTGGIALARLDLCNALGLSDTMAATIRLTDRLDTACLPPRNYYRDPAAAVDSLQEAQLLRLGVQAKELEKRMTMSDALPQVAVGGSYSYGRLINDSPSSNALLFASVRIPLSDWGKTGCKMKNIDYQIQKAANDRENLRSLLELQLRKFWLDVETAWEQLLLKEEAVSYAALLLRRCQADVDAGLATRSDLLQRQLDLTTAECDRVDARIAYKNAVTQFLSRCHSGFFSS